MNYQNMIRGAICPVCVSAVLCLTGCGVSLFGHLSGQKDELEFSCYEQNQEESSGAESVAASDFVGDREEARLVSVQEGASADKREAQPAASSAAADGKVDINAAGPEELMTLNGIGETRAKAIMEYRAQKGPFTKAEDIMQIPGIKEGIYAKIQDQIIVR